MEEFFYISSRLDEVKLKDLLLRRYHQIDFIKEMELEDALELINLALEDELRKEKRQEWLHLLPLMITADKYMDFESYYDKVTGRGIDLRSTEDIIAEIDAKHAAVREKQNGT